MATKLPALLSGGAEPTRIKPEELVARLMAMRPETWESVRDELLHRLAPEKMSDLAVLD